MKICRNCGSEQGNEPAPYCQGGLAHHWEEGDTRTGYVVELNSVPLRSPYPEKAEAEAFAAGYLAALDNNHIIWSGLGNVGCEIVTVVIYEDEDETQVEVEREIYA